MIIMSMVTKNAIRRDTIAGAKSAACARIQKAGTLESANKKLAYQTTNGAGDT